MTLRVQIIWSDKKRNDEIDLVSHPINKHLIKRIDTFLSEKRQINVVNIRSNRTVLINITDIEAIKSSGHLSQVITFKGELYYLNKRLKELSYLEKESLFKINQSTILNLHSITEFNVEANSRLAVTTKSDNQYLVSRYYAKKIKERLSC